MSNGDFDDDEFNDDADRDEFARESPTQPGSGGAIARVEATTFAVIARATDDLAGALEQVPSACERIPQDRRSAFYASVAARLSETAEACHEMRRWVQDAARADAEFHRKSNGHAK